MAGATYALGACFDQIVPMPVPRQTAGRPAQRRAAVIAGALTLLLALLGVALATDEADGRRAKVLGNTKRTPKPACPNNCSATAHVTGYQLRADGKRGLFKVKRTGHLVAWSVKLGGKPSKSDLDSFRSNAGHERLGRGPVARISVLKKVKKGRARFRLAKQTPTVRLGNSYGESPIITLDKPLKVRRGRVIALTVPTWLPNFATAGTRGDLWRASRNRRRCNVETLDDPNFRRSSPQMKRGSTRTYGCKYRGARLLYWGYVVPRRGGNS